MSKELLESIKKSLIETSKWLWVPAIGAPREIEFEEDGVISGSELLGAYNIVYGVTGQATMHLYTAQTQLVASLHIQSDGTWKGRESKSRGYCSLKSPQQNWPVWKAFFNQRKWKEDNQKVKPPATTVDTDKFVYNEANGPAIDWARYEYNLAELTKDHNLIENDTAICLIAYNRPHYFEQTIQSIGACEGIENYPVFLFIDQPVDDNLDDVGKQIELCQKVLPQTTVIRRPRNLGCGRNIIDARVQLFTNMKYERVFVFEDDMVVSPQYLNLCLRLWDWAKANYSNVDCVQAWNKCILSKSTKSKLAKEVQGTYTNWWGYLQGRESWAAMEDTVLQYQDMFLTSEYHLRNHRTIRNFFAKMRKESPNQVGDNPWANDFETDTHARRYFDQGPPTGQDAITMHTYEQCGYARLTTTVNRGLYIGKEGIHMNNQAYIADGFDHMALHGYKADSRRKKFSPRNSKTLITPVPSDNDIPKGITSVENI